MTRSRIFTIAAISLIILSTMAGIVPASAGVTSANLKVTIMDQYPYPAEIGQYMDITVQVENVGSEWADDVSIKIEPEYPFSVDSQANAVKNIGALAPKKIATKEFRIFVDKDAQKGTKSIDILTQTEKGSSWFESEFNIKVGTETFDSKGTLQIEGITCNPEVFMPGDFGTVTITLKNRATEDIVTIDGVDYDTDARVQSAKLYSNDYITVTSDPKGDMGIVKAGDEIDLIYNVEVSGDVVPRTYQLEHFIEGNSYSYNSKRNIPVKVDSAGIAIVPSKPLTLVGGEGTLEFDVANINPNTLSSVIVRPQSEGFEFSPSEYFIGSMDSDEMFTIEFDVRTLSPDASSTGDLNLTARFRNNLNEHETQIDGLSLETVEADQGGNSAVAAGGFLLAVLAVGGFLMYRRKSQK